MCNVLHNTAESASTVNQAWACKLILACSSYPTSPDTTTPPPCTMHQHNMALESLIRGSGCLDCMGLHPKYLLNHGVRQRGSTTPSGSSVTITLTHCYTLLHPCRYTPMSDHYCFMKESQCDKYGQFQHSDDTIVNRFRPASSPASTLPYT